MHGARLEAARLAWAYKTEGFSPGVPNMKARSAVAFAIVPITLFAAGCAQDGTLASGGLSTSSINPQAAKTDPACMTLATQIETLRKDGVADKVAKAAAKKYRMKTADLAKADELNKANAQFKAKCAPMPSQSKTASTAPATTTPRGLSCLPSATAMTCPLR